jgi:glycosyltransferase involved in cell wall biosynthesis
MSSKLKGMRIIWWIDHLDLGGAQQDLACLVESMAENGARQTVVCLNSRTRPSLLNRIDRAGVEVYCLSKTSLVLLFGLIKIWRVMRREMFDVSVTCLPNADLVGNVLASTARIPKRISSQVSSNRHFSSMRKLSLRYALAKSHYIVLNSYTYRSSVEGYAPSDIPIRVIPNGVKTPADSEVGICETIHSRLGLSSQIPLIGYVGRLSPEKRLRDLISAFSLLPDKDVHLVIVGEGPEKSALTSLAALLDVAPRVHFTGYLENVGPVFAGLSVFVLASSFEGMSNSLLEAMVSGCPVVVSDVDGSRELVEHGETGLRFQSGSTDAMRKMMVLVLKDQALAKTLAIKAKSFVLEKYSWEAQKGKWLQLLSECR